MTTHTLTQPSTHDILMDISDSYGRLYRTFGPLIPQSAAKRVAASCGIDDWTAFLKASLLTPDGDDMFNTLDLAMVLGL